MNKKIIYRIISPLCIVTLLLFNGVSETNKKGLENFKLNVEIWQTIPQPLCSRCNEKKNATVIKKGLF